MTLQELARVLQQARETGRPCAPLTEHKPDLTTAEAYAIQGIDLAHRRQVVGPHGTRPEVVGHKIGITSTAVQNWLGVDEPDFGVLLDDMVVPDGGEVDTARLLQPRVEGEVAFVLGRDLRGPGITAAHVIAATDFVLPAIEIIDSRIADWKITYQDTIADNASSGLFVLGNRPTPLAGLDLRLCGMVLRKNHRVASTGAGAACLDHPINAVVWLANTLGRLGTHLEAGHIILSGALGPVVPVEPGDHVEVAISGLGAVSARFT